MNVGSGRRPLNSWIAFFVPLLALAWPSAAAARDDIWHWTPASGPVTHYVVQLIFGPGLERERTIVVGVTTGTAWTIENAELWQPYAMQVFAISTTTKQRGPTSERSEIRYVLPPGCDPCCL